MSIIEFIRDIGINFRVNTLLSRDSVKNRLLSNGNTIFTIFTIDNNPSQGITFTEFSYQLFQAYDFAYLHKHYHCTFQVGGSDQWGNIASGIQYIRKTTSKEVFGATTNLLTDSKGDKLGKSCGNGLMLDPKVNSSFKFYQYFINCSDDSVEGLFKALTFMPLDKIEEIMNKHKEVSEGMWWK